MELLIGIWLFLAFFAAAVARERGYGAIGFFLLGLLLPIIAIILALMLPRRILSPREQAKMRPCPHCGEQILKVASRCKHCQSDVPEFPPEEDSWVKMVRDEAANRR